jgi:DNA adenine methylase
MNRVAKSPLRYPGGKSRAVEQILRYFPSQITEFREPFLGGGSVFLAAKSLYGNLIQRYWINDIYSDLIEFWTALRDQPQKLEATLRSLKLNIPEGRALYTLLKNPESSTHEFDRAVRFFVMNRITFSGVMDAGGYSQLAFEGRFTDSSIDRLERTSYHLQGVKITQGDYEEVLCAEGHGVFIFLDPPYWSATDSKLYGVKGELHTKFDHERFANVLKHCPHQWLMTYDDSPKIRDLFSFAHIVEWELQYGMNNYKRATAAKGKELFLTNRPT